MTKKTLLLHSIAALLQVEQEELQERYNRDILATIKNGKYLPINTQRANYKEKLTRWHVKHFVQYDVEINGMNFILKMEAIYNTERHCMYETPYSLKKPKDE